MYYIGVDYHKKYSYMVVKDKEGKIQKRGIVNNNKDELYEFLTPYREGEAVLEATRNWGLIYDWLEELLDDVTLAHPLKVRAIAEAKIKTDKISADILCDLLRTNLLPKAYAPRKETREAKNILRQRMFFVGVRTMVKNHIHTILDRHPVAISQCPDVSDMFGVVGTRWLRQTVLPGRDSHLLAAELDFLEFLKQKISESDGMVKELAKSDTKAKLLRSIPGLGPFFSVLVAKEIDDIRRFRDDKKLCAYAGLVPSTFASGGKVFHGKITKTGNKWLRWAFIEAVQPAIKSDADLLAYYQRLKIKKGVNSAKVATARRLLTIAYRILSQERLYRRKDISVKRGLAPAALVVS